MEPFHTSKVSEPAQWMGPTGAASALPYQVRTPAPTRPPQQPARRSVQHGSQVATDQQLHDNERLAVMRANVMDHGNAGML